jgi:hypothetical protein
MTRAEKFLFDFLEGVRALRAAANGNNGPFPYHCIEDFLLQHGRFFAPQRLPQGIKKGPERQCFENAGKVATRRGSSLFYVEGFALGVIPVHHAWASDTEGNVYEVTWQTRDRTEEDIAATAYFGVPFNADFVLRAMSETKRWGILDDVKREWPVLRGEYEPAEMFEPSLIAPLSGYSPTLHADRRRQAVESLDAKFNKA